VIIQEGFLPSPMVKYLGKVKEASLLLGLDSHNFKKKKKKNLCEWLDNTKGNCCSEQSCAVVAGV